MKYTVKATDKKGNSLKSIAEGNSEQEAIDNFLNEYEDTHWDFGGKIDWIKESKRYTYSIVGMGIFSLLGKIYEGGRIEIWDRKSDSGYADSEASYFIAKSDFEAFYNFFKDL